MASAQPPVPPPPSGDPALPPRSFGDVFSAAFEIYRNNFAKLIGIVAVVVIPLGIVSFLIGKVFEPKTTTQYIAGRPYPVVESRGLLVTLIAALIGAAIGIIINAILQAALVRGAAAATLGEPVDISDSYRWGLRRFGSILLVAFLVAIVTGIGFLLLIIPGIIFLAMFAVSIPAVVVEGQRGTSAMRRSWNLVKGHFWHVLGVVVVAAIIVGVVNGIFSRIGGSSTALSLILGLISQILTSPFSALVTVVLYLDLRTRAENLTMPALRAELDRSV